ncbi:sugar phosphate isomerase/epimerase [Verrucomicrobiales bacterium]|nr:sugar phosphate isomerase/epimerase [Verrucomicrobiales bacterium]
MPCHWIMTKADRRQFLTIGAAAAAAATTMLPGSLQAEHHKEAASSADGTVRPPASGKRILLSVKLGMIPKKIDGKELTLNQRLLMAKEAGLDGVDFDQAGEHTVEAAKTAVQETGVFAHNAINHAHWKDTLTHSDPAVRAKGRANIEHCLRLGHAVGGSGVLIVVGKGGDGTRQEVEERCREEIKALLPLAASLGQPILIENVWNQMFYDHGGSPDQGAERFVDFVDSFQSPWVGMYYDIGNHWKYGQPGEWIRAFGHRCFKLDVKGFSRARNKFTEIGEGDLPWDQVRQGLADINFTGWATAEVGGGDVKRLTKVREQMQNVFGLA